MTKEQALKMLSQAPRGDKPSRVNPSLTQAQAVEIVEKGIRAMNDGSILPHIFEKRAYQVTLNQRRPRY